MSYIKNLADSLTQRVIPNVLEKTFPEEMSSYRNISDKFETSKESILKSAKNNYNTLNKDFENSFKVGKTLSEQVRTGKFGLDDDQRDSLMFGDAFESFGSDSLGEFDDNFNELSSDHKPNSREHQLLKTVRNRRKNAANKARKSIKGHTVVDSGSVLLSEKLGYMTLMQTEIGNRTIKGLNAIFNSVNAIGSFLSNTTAEYYATTNDHLRVQSANADLISDVMTLLKDDLEERKREREQREVNNQFKNKEFALETLLDPSRMVNTSTADLLLGQMGLSGQMKEFNLDPLGFIAGAAIAHVGTNLFENQINSIRDFSATANDRLQSAFEDWSERGYAQNASTLDSIKGFLGSRLGIARNKSSTAKLGQYVDSEIGFDTQTKKAIVDVIPMYLAKILRAVDKDTSHKVYDAANGRFVNAEEMAKDKVKELSNIRHGNSFGGIGFATQDMELKGIDSKHVARIQAELRRQAKSKNVYDIDPTKIDFRDADIDAAYKDYIANASPEKIREIKKSFHSHVTRTNNDIERALHEMRSTGEEQSLILSDSKVRLNQRRQLRTNTITPPTPTDRTKVNLDKPNETKPDGSPSLDLSKPSSINPKGSPTDSRPNPSPRDSRNDEDDEQNGSSSIGDWISQKFIEPLVNKITTIFDKVGTFFQEKVFTPMSDMFKAGLQKVNKLFFGEDKANQNGLFTNIKEKMKDVWEKSTTFIKDKVVAPVNEFFTKTLNKKLFGDEKASKQGLMANIGDKFKEIWKSSKEFINEKIFTPIKSGINKSLEFTNKLFFGKEKANQNGLFSNIKDKLKEIGKSIYDTLLKPAGNAIRNLFGPVLKDFGSEIKFALVGFGQSLKSNFSSFFKDFSSKFSKTAKDSGKDFFDVIMESKTVKIIQEKITNPLKEVANKISETFNKAFKWLVNAPINLIRGATNAMKLNNIRKGKGNYSPEEIARLTELENQGKIWNFKDTTGTDGIIARAKEAKAARATKANGETKVEPVIAKNVNNSIPTVQNAASVTPSPVITPMGINGNKLPSNTRTDYPIPEGKKKEEEFKPTPKVENSTSTAKEIVKESTKAANKENTNTTAPKVPTITNETPNTNVKLSDNNESSAPKGIIQLIAANTTGILNFLKGNLKNVGANVESVLRHLRKESKSNIKDGGKKALSFFKNPILWLDEKVRGIVGFASGLVGSTIKGFFKGLNGIVGTLAQLPGQLAKLGISLVSSVAKGLAGILPSITKLATKAITGVAQVTGSLLSGLANIIGEIAGAAGKFVGATLDFAGQVIKPMGNFVVGLLDVSVKTLLPVLGHLGTAIEASVKGLFQFAGFLVSSIAKIGKSLMDITGRALGAVFNTGAKKVKDPVTAINGDVKVNNFDTLLGLSATSPLRVYVVDGKISTYTRDEGLKMRFDGNEETRNWLKRDPKNKDDKKDDNSGLLGGLLGSLIGGKLGGLGKAVLGGAAAKVAGSAMGTAAAAAGGGLLSKLFGKKDVVDKVTTVASPKASKITSITGAANGVKAPLLSTVPKASPINAVNAVNAVGNAASLIPTKASTVATTASPIRSIGAMVDAASMVSRPSVTTVPTTVATTASKTGKFAQLGSTLAGTRVGGAVKGTVGGLSKVGGAINDGVSKVGSLAVDGTKTVVKGGAGKLAGTRVGGAVVNGAKVLGAKAAETGLGQAAISGGSKLASVAGTVLKSAPMRYLGGAAKGFGIGGAISLGGGLAADVLFDKGTAAHDMTSQGSEFAGYGAMIGSLILPGVGTAIGTAVGGLVGTVKAAIPHFEKKYSEEILSVTTYFQDIPKRVAAFAEALPDRIDSFISSIPDAITKLFEPDVQACEANVFGENPDANGIGSGSLLTRMFSAMGGALWTIIKNIPRIGMSIIQGMLKGLYTVISAGSTLVYEGAKNMLGKAATVIGNMPERIYNWVMHELHSKTKGLVGMNDEEYNTKTNAINVSEANEKARLDSETAATVKAKNEETKKNSAAIGTYNFATGKDNTDATKDRNLYVNAAKKYDKEEQRKESFVKGYLQTERAKGLSEKEAREKANKVYEATKREEANRQKKATDSAATKAAATGAAVVNNGTNASGVNSETTMVNNNTYASGGRFSPAVMDAMTKAGNQFNIPFATMKGIAHIESKGDPNAKSKSGSYLGLYQMGKAEFAKHHVAGTPNNIFDPLANAMAAASYMSYHSKEMQKRGIPVNATTLYLAHQQGLGGVSSIYKAANGQGTLSAGTMANMKNNPPQDERGATTNPNEFINRWSAVLSKVSGESALNVVNPNGDGVQYSGNGGTNATASNSEQNDIATEMGNKFLTGLSNSSLALSLGKITGHSDADAAISARAEAAKIAASNPSMGTNSSSFTSGNAVTGNAASTSGNMVGREALAGLKIKSSESTAGGKVTDHTAEFAKLASSTIGSNVKYFSAFNDAYHQGKNSLHSKGQAFDLVLNDPKQSPQVVQALKQAASQNGFNIGVLDEYKTRSGNWTGGHIHVSVTGRKPGTGSTNGAVDSTENNNISGNVAAVTAKADSANPGATNSALGDIANITAGPAYRKAGAGLFASSTVTTATEGAKAATDMNNTNTAADSIPSVAKDPLAPKVDGLFSTDITGLNVSNDGIPAFAKDPLASKISINDITSTPFNGSVTPQVDGVESTDTESTAAKMRKYLSSSTFGKGVLNVADIATGEKKFSTTPKAINSTNKVKNVVNAPKVDVKAVEVGADKSIQSTNDYVNKMANATHSVPEINPSESTDAQIISLLTIANTHLASISNNTSELEGTKEYYAKSTTTNDKGDTTVVQEAFPIQANVVSDQGNFFTGDDLLSPSNAARKVASFGGYSF